VGRERRLPRDVPLLVGTGGSGAASLPARARHNERAILAPINLPTLPTLSTNPLKSRLKSVGSASAVSDGARYPSGTPYDPICCAVRTFAFLMRAREHFRTPLNRAVSRLSRCALLDGLIPRVSAWACIGGPYAGAWRRVGDADRESKLRLVDAAGATFRETGGNPLGFSVGAALLTRRQ
jgi:hypothetical protein